MTSTNIAKHDPTQWLQKDVKDVPAPARELLETYSGVPADEVLPHALALRDEAFAVYPWPCIGQMRFLRFTLSTYPAYPRILSRLKAVADAAYLLDLGCCFGQDLRKLVVDGVSPAHVAGLDVGAEFYSLGRRLFRDDVALGDRPALSFDFYARDIMDDGADWEPLESRFDILNSTSFLHIWDWEGQIKAACRIVSFLRLRPGALIVGSGLGSRVGGEFPNLEGDGTNFRQSPETFVGFWAEVGQKTGTSWDVHSDLQLINASAMNAGQKWAEPNMGVLFFEVTLK